MEATGFVKDSRGDMVRYRTVIVYISILMLIFALCIGGIAAYMYDHKPVPYPGKGVYDLTTYFPCSVQGEMCESSIEMLEYDFLTNSTEIRITNEASSNVMIYLYDTSDETNTAIGEFSWERGETKKFTNLTSARDYRIGVEALEQKYALIISD